MTVVPPRVVPLAEFPHSTADPVGMKVLAADPTPVYGTALLGVPYAEKDGHPLTLQILLPPTWEEDVPQTFPCVVFVPGSAWRKQDLGRVLPALAEFTRRGYVVAVVEYRSSAVAAFPAQVKDAKTAVRFLRGHAAEYHIDTARMAMWGDSSGGHTAVLACLTLNDREYSDEPVGDELGLRCVVDYYGPTDISRMNEDPSIQDHVAPDSPEGMLIGGRNVLENPDLVAPTVAVSHLGGEVTPPPMLIVHGSKDRVVPFGQSALLFSALSDAGHPVELYQLRGSDHAGPAFWQPAVLDLVDDFLKVNLA
ncbi:alpha/beta hydrolase [Amycolatopsis jiangsuensis]|uniref:Acetyl esterase/lipase n=1 Tax=Amycolatopsis jiangsuensis TaxID=1181879 RepID=A0A840J3I9_9PSEU|nr:alpha/beta hydrolase [Amycolatopsis jiangsuensis]MBB4689631.1 acetyl esterase/lipase [Amycolatopsis jiangsuensis]